MTIGVENYPNDDIYSLSEYMRERLPFSNQLSPEYLLLGMLALSPSHGYELHRQIERDLRYVWRLSLSQVYNVLARLERQGLIAGELVEQDERPDRKRFKLTHQGRRHFQAWFAAPLRASVHAVRIAFLSKLYFGRHLPEVDVAALVDEQRLAIEHGIERLETRLAGLGSADPILEQSLQLRVMQLRTLLAWMLECQKTWIPNISGG